MEGNKFSKLNFSRKEKSKEESLRRKGKGKSSTSFVVREFCSGKSEQKGFSRDAGRQGEGGWGDGEGENFRNSEVAEYLFCLLRLGSAGGGKRGGGGVDAPA